LNVHRSAAKAEQDRFTEDFSFGLFEIVLPRMKGLAKTYRDDTRLLACWDEARSLSDSEAVWNREGLREINEQLHGLQTRLFEIDVSLQSSKTRLDLLARTRHLWDQFDPDESTGGAKRPASLSSASAIVNHATTEA
jgi:hypothetical protein